MNLSQLDTATVYVAVDFHSSPWNSLLGNRFYTCVGDNC